MNPNKIWHSAKGRIPIKNLTDDHLINIHLKNKEYETSKLSQVKKEIKRRGLIIPSESQDGKTKFLAKKIDNLEESLNEAHKKIDLLVELISQLEAVPEEGIFGKLAKSLAGFGDQDS